MQVEQRKLSPMQVMAARAMAKSHAEAVTVTIVGDIGADAMVEMLADLNAARAAAGEPRVTDTQAVIKAVSLALRDFPDLNAHFAEGVLSRLGSIDIGMAVANAEGELMVPVLRGVDRMELGELAHAARRLIDRARGAKLELAELKGAGFTVSSVTGARTVRYTTPVVPLPQVAILAMAPVRTVPVVRGGKVAAGRVLPVSLSFDHRPVNGAMASAFLDRLAEIIERPARLAEPATSQQAGGQTR